MSELRACKDSTLYFFFFYEMTKRAHSELAVGRDIPWQVVLPILVECLATGYSSVGQLALVCKSWHYAYASPDLVTEYFERTQLDTDDARAKAVLGNHRVLGLGFVQNFLGDWFVLGSYGVAGNALLDQLLPKLTHLGRPEFLVRMLHRMVVREEPLDDREMDALFQRVYEIVIRSRNAQLFHEIRVRFKLRAYHPGVAMLASLEAQALEPLQICENWLVFPLIHSFRYRGQEGPFLAHLCYVAAAKNTPELVRLAHALVPERNEHLERWMLEATARGAVVSGDTRLLKETLERAHAWKRYWKPEYDPRIFSEAFVHNLTLACVEHNSRDALGLLLKRFPSLCYLEEVSHCLKFDAGACLAKLLLYVDAENIARNKHSWYRAYVSQCKPECLRALLRCSRVTLETREASEIFHACLESMLEIARELYRAREIPLDQSKIRALLISSAHRGLPHEDTVRFLIEICDNLPVSSIASTIQQHNKKTFIRAVKILLEYEEFRTHYAKALHKSTSS